MQSIGKTEYTSDLERTKKRHKISQKKEGGGSTLKLPKSHSLGQGDVHGVQSTGRGQHGMGQGGVDGLSVGGGAETINNDIALHGVGVVQTSSTDSGNASDGSRFPRGGFQEVANLDSISLGSFAIDVEVVTSRELNGTHSGLELNKSSLCVIVSVGKHKHFTVFLGANADVLANLTQ